MIEREGISSKQVEFGSYREAWTAEYEALFGRPHSTVRDEKVCPWEKRRNGAAKRRKSNTADLQPRKLTTTAR